MTITKVDLTKHEGSTDQNGRRFDVEYDVEYTGLYDPLVAAAISSITYDGDPVDLEIGADVAAGVGVYLRNRQIAYIEGTADGGSFTIKLAYQDGLQFVENPLERPDVIQWRRFDEQRQIFQDVDKKAILTTAREIYAQMPTAPTARFAATITGYRSDYRFSYDDDSEFNLVNHAAITLDGIPIAKGTARYAGANVAKERINSYTVYTHTWQLEFKQSWKLKTLNIGNYELKSGKQVRIKDSMGLFRQTPWPLNAAGVALPDNYSSSQVLYNEFDTVVEINFGYFDWAF